MDSPEKYTRDLIRDWLLILSLAIGSVTSGLLLGHALKFAYLLWRN